MCSRAALFSSVPPPATRFVRGITQRDKSPKVVMLSAEKRLRHVVDMNTLKVVAPAIPLGAYRIVITNPDSEAVPIDGPSSLTENSFILWSEIGSSLTFQ